MRKTDTPPTRNLETDTEPWNIHHARDTAPRLTSSVSLMVCAHSATIISVIAPCSTYPRVGNSTPSVDFGAVEDGEQVDEEFVGFFFDAVEDVGDVVKVGVGVAAGDDAAVVVALVEFDLDHDRERRVLV